MASVIQREDIDFAAYIRETEAKQKVRAASEYVGELIDALFNGKKDPCAYLPWDKTHREFALRPGEVTLWAGINGHGKSLVTGQVSLSLMGQSEKVCIASFEMKPRKTMERMARQWHGAAPTSEYDTPEMIAAAKGIYRQFGEWTDRKLWLYDQQGTVDADTVLGVARYCAKELGITHIFIDSLMKCVKGEDDYNGQKYFVDTITAIARDFGVHIHLVHHLRKPKDENEVPDKHDNKGSGSITDQVDNVMMVWRNKRKEDDIKLKGTHSNHKTEPDARLLCRKQRNGDHEPSIALWFNADSNQYLGNETDSPMKFYSEF